MAVIDFTNFHKGFKSDYDFYSFQQAVAGLSGKNTGGAQVKIVNSRRLLSRKNRYSNFVVQVETNENEFYSFEMNGKFKYNKKNNIYKGTISDFKCSLAGAGNYSVEDVGLKTKAFQNIFKDVYPELVKGNDTIIGSMKSSNVINGGRGNDVLVAGPGTDTEEDILYGGDGYDKFDLTRVDIPSAGYAVIMDYFSDKSSAEPKRDSLRFSGSDWDEYDQEYWGEAYNEIWRQGSGLVADIYYSSDSIPDANGNYGLYASFIG